VSAAAEVSRAPAVEGEGNAPRSDAVTADSVKLAAARAVDTAAPTAEGELTVASAERGASSAAVASPSEGDVSSGDSTDAGSGVATIQQAAATANTGATARQATSLDPTPLDEGAASAVAEAPAIEQSGGGGALIVAAAAVGAAVPAAPSTNPASGAVPVPASSSGGAWGRGASDALVIGEIGPDRSLLTNADASISPVATMFGRSAAPRALTNRAGEPAPAVDSEGDPEGVASEPPPVEEAAPPPRCADLVTEFLPFGRASLEGAVDRFLAPFDRLGSELIHWQSPVDLIPAATVVATAALAWEAVRRRARAGTTAHEEREEDFARFPGYPTAWSLGES
jgi:hypothetical protein